jgi:serine protease Do
MRTARIRALAALLAGSAMLAAACGGGDDGESADTTAAAETTTPATTEATTTTAATPEGLVTSVDDIKQATVQVLAAGSFRDPAEGTQASYGSGSGFIIDPDGIVVTNNHVVTGAGAIEVRIGGSDEEVPARVLGVSECSDLAVLQLVDPGPYPYVEWYTGEIAPPLEVYTAGFPLGDPEFTITRGVVSKASADGNTQWASVRRVIEHDANIQPGNSGGPLVNEDGQVVAVNYAGGDPGTGTAQFFAISSELAAPLVEELREGDTETIGVNGEAVVSEDGSLIGVWVAGVEAGSAAAKAGVLPGDVITKLNGVEMSPYTMEAYCDVLRSSNEGDAIGIEIIRFDTEEVWAGELNGAPMVARFSFAQELEDELPTDSGDSGGQASASYTYEEIADDTNTIFVRLPVEWGDRDTAPQDIGFGGPTPAIVAAPSLDSFLSTSTAPGMLFLYIPTGAEGATADELLDASAPADCVDQGRSDYSDPLFEGRQQYFVCQDTSLAVLVVASPIANPGAKVFVGVQAVTDADLEALDEVLRSFNVAG